MGGFFVALKRNKFGHHSRHDDQHDDRQNIDQPLWMGFSHDMILVTQITNATPQDMAVALRAQADWFDKYPDSVMDLRGTPASAELRSLARALEGSIAATIDCAGS